MPTKTNEDCPPSVRRYFQRIGSMGGQAGKGTELRKEISRRNAKKRWAMVKANNGENWKKPKGKPKRKRPQAKPPKKRWTKSAARALTRELANRRHSKGPDQFDLEPKIGFGK